jgi:hypothetical protein
MDDVCDYYLGGSRTQLAGASKFSGRKRGSNYFWNLFSVGAVAYPDNPWAVVVIALIVRNLVLGVAFGFVMLNMLLMVTSQDPERVALCVFLTLVVTVTYLASTRNHVVQSIKGRRWKELFTGLE